MPISEIEPRVLAARLAGPEAQRPLLIDVRSAEENAHVALPGSRLWPLPELEEHVKEFAELGERDVVVYCHHGVRSQHGAAFLQQHGVQASSLAGGIERYAVEVDTTMRRY